MPRKKNLKPEVRTGEDIKNAANELLKKGIKIAHLIKNTL